MERKPYYTVPADAARTGGPLTTTYRTRDGRFILSDKAMHLVLNQNPGRSVEELGAKVITEQQARTLIKQGGYKMGEETQNSNNT